MFRRPEEKPAVEAEVVVVEATSSTPPVVSEEEAATSPSFFRTILGMFFGQASKEVQADLDRRVSIEKRSGDLLRRLK